MKVFVDTSGFYGFLNADDPFHARAKRLLLKAEGAGWRLFTSSFVVHESWSLIQARLGWEAVDDWLGVILPRCDVHWVSPGIYEKAASRCRQARSRRLSLTDCVSFEVMTEAGCRCAIADDVDFRHQGFKLPA